MRILRRTAVKLIAICSENETVFRVLVPGEYDQAHVIGS
jgi:hypothetical protein